MYSYSGRSLLTPRSKTDSPNTQHATRNTPFRFAHKMKPALPPTRLVQQVNSKAFTGLLLCWVVLGFRAFGADASDTNTPPTSWVDPDTGHRIIRLTREPGSDSFYFNVNGYTPDGKRMAYTTPNGISVLN